MLVRDVMNKIVKTAEPEESILEATKRMNEFSIGCLIVVKKGKLVGIITERDILEKLVAENKLASKVKVKQVMTKNPIIIEDDKDISEAVDVMAKHQIKKLPVISGQKLVGILTTDDLAKVQPKLIKQISSLLVFPKRGKAVAG
jgi:CBS domain-containing protein